MTFVYHDKEPHQRVLEIYNQDGMCTTRFKLGTLRFKKKIGRYWFVNRVVDDVWN